MNDAELRELDAWIAKKFMGWVLDTKRMTNAWISKETREVMAWEEYGNTGVIFQPTRLPAAFALVKREIERRGWRWVCAYDRLSKVYGFEITIEEDAIGIVAETEELVGCLAVKAAIEGMA